MEELMRKKAEAAKNNKKKDSKPSISSAALKAM